MILPKAQSQSTTVDDAFRFIEQQKQQQQLQNPYSFGDDIVGHRALAQQQREHQQLEQQQREQQQILCQARGVHAHDVALAPPDDLTRVVYTILMPVVCVLGAVGAAICILIFTRRQMRSSLSVYLAGLSAFDLLVLVMSLLIYPSMNICLQEGNRGPVCHFFWRTSLATYPLSLIAQTGSVWTCVAITVDRFLAVQYPLHMRAWCTPRRARIVLNYIAIVAILYKMPSIFELSLDECGRLQPTQLRNHPLYIIIYITYGYLLLLFVIPFFVIIVLNVVIVNSVRAATIRRRQMQNIQQHRQHSDDYHHKSGPAASTSNASSRFKFSVCSTAGISSLFNAGSNSGMAEQAHAPHHRMLATGGGSGGEDAASTSPSGWISAFIVSNANNTTNNANNNITCNDNSSYAPNSHLNGSAYYHTHQGNGSNGSATGASGNGAVHHQNHHYSGLQTTVPIQSPASLDYDKRCTNMVIVTIVTFVLFNWLTGVNNVIEAFYLSSSRNSYRIPIGNLLICLNSATNILIYSIFGQRFRKICAALLCPCFKGKYDSLSRSGY